MLARAFTGPLARGLENWWTRELASRIAELPPWIAELPPFPIPSWFVGQLRAAALAAGATDVMSPWIGRIAPNLVHRGASALLDAPW